MNGDLLIARIRNILGDEQSLTDIGNYWSDREIILALNASQSVITNFLIQAKAYHTLVNLAKVEVYNGVSAGNLPTNYMKYISGQVSKQQIPVSSGDIISSKLALNIYPSPLKTAQIYNGGDGIPYFNTNHTALYIVNNIIYCNDYNATDTLNFILYYWEYPSYIGATSLGDNARTDFLTNSFPNYIYDLIVNHASGILGMKEPQTIRDVKFFKDTTKNLGLLTTPTDNYINASDIQENMLRGQK